ncbi:MAG: hypothetical protein J7J91_07815, partial [Deltaproteobacteria bacterium]|nr:hypothetical protein [Deltaproteobacteria bacterium]
QTVDIADLPLRQDLLAKNVLMTAQRNFCLGNNPLMGAPTVFSLSLFRISDFELLSSCLRYAGDASGAVTHEAEHRNQERYGFPLAEVARQQGVPTSAISRARSRLSKT